MVRLCQSERCLFKDTSIVYVNIETSSFAEDADILQIAAKIGTDHYFNCFVKPRQDVDPHANAVNGLRKEGSNLYLNDIIVKTVSITVALMKFRDFLQAHCIRCVLVTHSTFHLRYIFQKVRQMGIANLFNQYFYAYCDTSRIFPILLPGRTGEGSYALLTLAKEFLGGDTSNNAVNKTIILRKLVCKFMKRNEEAILKYKVEISNCKIGNH